MRHTLAVTETNGELNQFLQWYSTSVVDPNITVLGMKGSPQGTGRTKRWSFKTKADKE